MHFLPQDLSLQAQNVLSAAQAHCGTLLSVCIHGSIALDGYVPGRSDLDILILAKSSMTRSQRIAFADELLKYHNVPCPIELSVLTEDGLSEHPPVCTFHFSSLWAPRYAAHDDTNPLLDSDFPDGDIPPYFRVAADCGICLFGAKPADVFPAVSDETFFSSISCEIEDFSFDDYDLANNVAQFPLPIVTGIGHERDNTVLDYISWWRVKTPTAAAEWLIAQADKMMNSVEQLSKSIVLNAREYLSSQKEQMAYLSTTIPHTAQSLLDNARATLQRYAISIPANARTRVSTSLASLDHIADTIRSATAQRVAMARLEIERLDSCVEILNPRNTLNRGYALIRKNGKFITSSDQLEPGDEIVTNLKSGTVRSIVKQIKH